MKISIRIKLIVVLTGFTVVLLGIAAYVFVMEKTNEMTHDIFLNTVQFAELSSEKIATNYDLYLEEEGFLYFNRDVRAILDKNDNVYALKLVSYVGDIVYDSEFDKTEKYVGKSRVVKDQTRLYQIQSVNPSVATFDDEVLYLMTDDDGKMNFVDDSESLIDPLKAGAKIKYVVQPASSKFAVVYEMTYENLIERVNSLKWRMIYLALLGVLLGIPFAFAFSQKISNSIKALAKGAEVISTGDFKHKVYLHTNDELEILGNAFNKMGEDLDKSTKTIIEHEQVKKELELAASMQMSLLPDELPKVLGMDIAAGLLPAEEVGGDCYDFIKPDDNTLVAYVGDATGHGVPAALVVSIANALFYTFSQNGDIKNALIEANKVLKVKTTTSMFITLCMLRYDAKTGQTVYVSAGHEKVLLFKAKENKVYEMPSGGMALGMLPDLAPLLKVENLPMEKGDVAILYSDGIPEAWKSQTETYGMGSLKRAVQEYSDLPTAESIKNALLADVKEFCGKYPQMDDMTVLVFKKG